MAGKPTAVGRDAVHKPSGDVTLSEGRVRRVFQSYRDRAGLLADEPEEDLLSRSIEEYERVLHRGMQPELQQVFLRPIYRLEDIKAVTSTDWRTSDIGMYVFVLKPETAGHIRYIRAGSASSIPSSHNPGALLQRIQQHLQSFRSRSQEAQPAARSCLNKPS